MTGVSFCAAADLIPTIFCGAADTIYHLLQLLDPILACLEERLASSHEVDTRCSALATCIAIWERACERWPEADANVLRTLAAELANCACAALHAREGVVQHETSAHGGGSQPAVDLRTPTRDSALCRAVQAW